MPFNWISLLGLMLMRFLRPWTNRKIHSVCDMERKKKTFLAPEHEQAYIHVRPLADHVLPYHCVYTMTIVTTMCVLLLLVFFFFSVLVFSSWMGSMILNQEREMRSLPINNRPVRINRRKNEKWKKKKKLNIDD